MKQPIVFNTVVLIIMVLSALVFIQGCASTKKYHYDMKEVSLKDETKFDCQSSREYITALEFLRETKDLAVNEPDARKIATSVAKGCTGAAQRFIHVTGLLTKSHLTGKNAVEAAIKLSQKTDKQAGTFIEVFQRAFLSEYLDMDINASVSIAHSLTTEFDGRSEIAISDFKDISMFCLDLPELKYEKQECGRLAARLAGYGQKSHEKLQMSVAMAFKEGFAFLRSGGDSGPSMQPGETITLLEKLIQISPKAVDNYKQAFLYAIKKSGLGVPMDAAEKFAFEMAEYTENQTPTSSAIKKRN